MSSALRSAAETAAVEASAECRGAILDAAEEIAAKHGFESPRAKSPPYSRGSSRVYEDRDIDREAASPNAANPKIIRYEDEDRGRSSSHLQQEPTTPTVARAPSFQALERSNSSSKLMQEVDASAELLIEAIRGPSTSKRGDRDGEAPRPKQDASFDDTADRRRRSTPSGSTSSRRGSGADNLILSSTNVASSQEHARNRYLALRKSLTSRDDGAGARKDGSSSNRGGGGDGGGGGRAPITAERSRVSQALERSSSNGPGASLRTSSVHSISPRVQVSAPEEALFRSMQRMVRRPSTSSSSRPGSSSSSEAAPAKAESKRSEMDIINRLSSQQHKSGQKDDPPEYLGIMLKTRRPGSAGHRRPMASHDGSKRRDSKRRDHSPGSDDDRDGGKTGPGKYSFVERQEAVERSRVDRLNLTVAKATYDALIDKKFCPKCKAKQSYDDIKEKRKKCNNCRVDYVTHIEWNKVKRDFYNRQQKQIEDVEKQRKQLAEEIEREGMKGYKPVYDREKGKIVLQAVDYSEHARHQKWDKEMEADFYGRMEEVNQRRLNKVKKLEDEMYGDVGKTTLQLRKSSTGSSGPGKLTDRSLGSLGFGDANGTDAVGMDAVAAFLQRYKEDLERRAQMRARLAAEEAERRHRALGLIAESKESVKHDRPFR